MKLGYILRSCFIFLICGIILPHFNLARGENSSTTFPVNEAGIAAYVRVDNINDINLKALAETLYSVEKQGESYIIGTVAIRNFRYAANGGSPFYYDSFTYPHVYIGLDGWIVAYYLRTEEKSKIVQWENLNSTTLKDAIDVICQKAGLSYSMPIKYYDFEFPEANKMTIIIESQYKWIPNEGSFYVTIPGTLYEASYSLYFLSVTSINLKVDGATVFSTSTSFSRIKGPFYGFYERDAFSNSGVAHHITIECSSLPAPAPGYNCSGKVATVLVYRN